MSQVRFLCFLLILQLLLPELSTARGLRFYGDLLLARGIARFAAEQGAGQLDNALVPFLSRDAIHIVNLEGAVGKPEQCAAGHNPCFATRSRMLSLLKGFDVVSLENNHSLDLGPAGLKKTTDELRKRNIIPLGGKSFSTIIATDEGDFGIVAVTDIVNAPVDRNQVMSADSPEVFREIKRLKARTTAVVIYIHWGREFMPVATARMQELAKRYVAAGADAIVGSHPHETGTAACIDGKPVVWSLGNFLFDQKFETTKRGALLDCAVGKDARFTCAMSGIETPMGSFLPHAVLKERFTAENQLLAGCTPHVTNTWSGRFTKDRRKKRLVLKRETPQASLAYLELYDLATGKREIKSPPMPIRKVQPVDLNRDGIKEIMLIQEIYSSFDKETAKRVYIYSMDGGFHAVWRGSALSRPMLDATFTQTGASRPLLVALHSADSFLARKPATQERIVMGYHWNGFGFSGTRMLKTESGCDSIVCTNGTVRLLSQGNIIGRIPVGALR